MKNELQIFDTPEADSLIDALLEIETKAEAKRFLRDLLTPYEIEEFSRRFQAARLLAEGVPYTEISEETGLSSTTVARISKWLNQGMGGYKLVLGRLYKIFPKEKHSHHYHL